MSNIKNIALVGGSGQIGSRILSALLRSPTSFNVSAITRAESSATFPPGVEVRKGDFADDRFFVSSLKNIDAVVMALSFQSPPDLQSRIIAAAAEAGVPFVIPNEFGSDNGFPSMRDGIPINASKTHYRQEIEKLGVSSWIGIASNPWYDYSLQGGWFGIDIPARKATLYDDGAVKFNTTTRDTVGLAVAKLLALPRETLDSYKNRFVYISSFHISQREILDSVQRVTKTTDDDWTIEQKSAQGYLDESSERVKKGDFYGLAGMLYGSHFKTGLGGDFEMNGRSIANDVLGLPKQEIDVETAKVVDSLTA